MEIHLDKEVFAEVAAELNISPPDLGSESQRRGLSAEVNNRPIAIRYKDLCESTGIVSAEFSALARRFEVYLVPHAVSVIRRSGFSEITTFGMEIEYLADEHTCSILGLFPNSKWTTWGEIGAAAKADGEAGLAGGGSDGWISLDAAELRVRAQANGNLGIRWAEKVITPEISATGIGSSRCEWQFEKRDEPLFGRDLQAWSLIATPRRLRNLKHKCRYYFVSRTAFIPSRVESDWVELNCDLPAK